MAGGLIHGPVDAGLIAIVITQYHPPLKVNWSWGGLIHGPVDPRFNRYRNYTVSHGTATSCLSGPHVVGLAPPPVNPTAVDTEGGGSCRW